MARPEPVDDGADDAPAVCESCGADDDDLRPVWPSPGPNAVAAVGGGESAELWCAGCRAQFPHEAATDDDGDGDGDGDDNEGDDADEAG